MKRFYIQPNLFQTIGRTAWLTRTLLLMGAVFWGGLSQNCQASLCQSNESKDSKESADPHDEKELTPEQQLERKQKELAERYQLLEEKLFSLYEFEQDNNPDRARLLQRAFIQSQEKMTSAQMKAIVARLSQSRLKDAEQGQAEVLDHLKQLLTLLQSEDRGKRVRDEIRRHQAYLKEVERLLRIQKGIRGQNEGGVDTRRLARSEAKAAERTERLARNIQENEEAEEADPEKGGKPDEASPPKSSEKNDPQKNASPDKGDPQDGSTPPTQPPGEEPGSEPGSKGTGKGTGPSGGPAPPSGGAPSPSGASPSASPPQDSGNPIRKRIQAAQKKMQEAQKKLEQAQRDDATDAMQQAEREMALAKRELEAILRQLREEEVERSLAMLESRFRIMLERQVRLLEATRKLNRVSQGDRNADFAIQCGKRSQDQQAIAMDAAKTLMLLHEDGSSIAFPTTVEDMQQDMTQVASRLAATKVGSITIEIEEDIIETLDYLIKALVQTQEDLERMRKRGQGQGGAPGDQPLVDQLAEIKMLRGLQQRIHKRHQRYSRLLEQPDDPVGASDDPDLQVALDRLAKRQAQLAEIARELVNKKNQ